MKIIWVRPSNGKDMAEIMNWAAQGKDNFFDPSVLSYPATVTLAAFNDKTIVHVPIQSVFVLESLAINPQATAHEISVGLREVVSAAVLQAQKAGVGEIYFMGTNEQTNKFAERHGFERMPWDVYRLRIDNLGLSEAQDENIPKSRS